MTSAQPRDYRIGVLGTARIAPAALIRPARSMPTVTVAAVAARDPDRARRFARRHAIPTVHATYGDLIADPTLDAVYNPLPNSHHGLWTRRALRAGKDVLCEKPLAANAREAAETAQVAETEGRLLLEAFHYRYHPLMARVLEIVGSGELGELHHLEAHFCGPMWRPWDIRWRYDLAGGSLMDMGCYCVHMVRTLAQGEPQVTAARAWSVRDRVDRRMRADLTFPGGVSARIESSFLSRRLVRISLSARGTHGRLWVLNPVVPHYFHRLTVETRGRRRSETVAGDTTYGCQLQAFVAAARGQGPMLTGPGDAVNNMRVIDEIYSRAGLPLRQPVRDPGP